MYIDIYLEEEEVEHLEGGGFITLLLDGGIRVTVTIDTDDNE